MLLFIEYMLFMHLHYIHKSKMTNNRFLQKNTSQQKFFFAFCVFNFFLISSIVFLGTASKIVLGGKAKPNPKKIFSNFSKYF